MEGGRVEAALGDELGVGALFDDATGFEDDDLVGAADGGDFVRDDDAGRPGEEPVESLLDSGLGLGVEGAGAVIEEEHAGFGDDGAGQRQALTLTARQGIAAFADRRIEAVGQGIDGGREIGDGQCLAHFRFGRIGVGVEQVGSDRSREQERLLGHQ